MRRLIVSTLLLLWMLTLRVGAYAQCSMCRASMENSISRDSDQFSAGLNLGILYLFIMPYLLLGLITYFWYRASRKNGQKVKIRINSQGKMSPM